MLGGLYPILETPFTPRGAVDEDGLRAEVAFLAARGCEGVTLFGISGEYYKLTDAEAARMLAVTVDAARRAGVQCIVSNTRHSTHAAREQARAFADAGADAQMLLPPFFLKPSAADIEAHVLAVAACFPGPTIVQYAPEQTGVAIAPRVLASWQDRLETPLLYKIECKPMGGYLSALRAESGGRAQAFVGYAGLQLIEGLDRGAVGAMPGPSVIEIYRAVFDRYRDGARGEAKALHAAALLPLMNQIFQSSEMIIYYEKRILRLRGVIGCDLCRAPTFAEDETDRRLFDECWANIQPFLDAYSAPRGRIEPAK